MNSETIQTLVAILMVATFTSLFIVIINANKKEMREYLSKYLAQVKELSEDVELLGGRTQEVITEIGNLRENVFRYVNPLGAIELYSRKSLTNIYSYSYYDKKELKHEYFEALHTDTPPELKQVNGKIVIAVGAEKFTVDENKDIIREVTK